MGAGGQFFFIITLIKSCSFTKNLKPSAVLTDTRGPLTCDVKK
jgi:hypothetical protein